MKKQLNQLIESLKNSVHNTCPDRLTVMVTKDKYDALMAIPGLRDLLMQVWPNEMARLDTWCKDQLEFSEGGKYFKDGAIDPAYQIDYVEHTRRRPFLTLPFENYSNMIVPDHYFVCLGKNGDYTVMFVDVDNNKLVTTDLGEFPVWTETFSTQMNFDDRFVCIVPVGLTRIPYTYSLDLLLLKRKVELMEKEDTREAILRFYSML